MSDFKTLSNMMKLADAGQKLPDDWNDENLKAMRKPLEHAVEVGRKQKEHLGFYDSSAYGYSCPVCNGTPEKFVKNITFGSHILGTQTYYVLTCNCENDFDSNIDHNKGVIDRTNSADIPEAYRTTSWNAWDTSVDKGLTDSFKRAANLSTGSGIRKILGQGLVLFGDVGRGKTHTGICLLKSIIDKTKLKCKYISMADFTNKIIRSGQDGKYLEEIEKFDVLFLDDLDKLSMASAWVQERVFSLFDEIFRSNKTLILSTNLKSIPDMEKYFGVHGEAIISRMVDKMEFIRFTGGDDYRKKRRMDKNKSK